MYNVSVYSDDDKTEWDAFVSKSRQGTFLFQRPYMDYHRDRFKDCSLMLRQEDKLRAMLPANISGSTLYSHQGLTYGGLLTDSRVKAVQTADIFKSINAFLRREGITHVVYKAIPWIYHRIPAEEDLYALTNICGARLTVRELSTTIIPGRSPRMEESRRSGLRKAERAGITVGEDNDLHAFYTILDNNLENKYHTRPVHSEAELRLLMSRFPENIRLYMARRNGQPLGGTIIYDTGQVVHTQYISATPEGKAEGALDMLLSWLFTKIYAGRPYIDFGKSTEQAGRVLNTALIFQKEGFGGRGVCYDTYEWEP